MEIVDRCDTIDERHRYPLIRKNLILCLSLSYKLSHKKTRFFFEAREKYNRTCVTVQMRI